MRSLRRISGLLALVILATACSAAPPSPPPAQNAPAKPTEATAAKAADAAARPTAPPAAAPTSAPAAAKPAASGGEKVLVVAQPGDATTMDANMHNNTPTRNIHLNMFGSPVLRDNDGKIQPALAESWSNPDPLTWVFKVRKGVKFHNGYDLTADDLKFSLERILDPQTKSPRASNWPSVDKLEVPDPYTFIVHTKEPYALTLARMSGSFDIVSKKYYEEVGAEKAIQNPVGTGPFKFKEWTKNQQVVLEAFDQYWGGRPKIDRVIFRAIPEPSTRLAELLAGTVDVVTDVSADQAADLETKSGVKVVNANATRVEFIALDNTRDGPLKDVRVRQALNYAVDKDGLLKALYGGHGSVIGQPLSQSMFGYNPDVKPYPYDPDKAKQLLADAGFGSGLSIDFDCGQADKDTCEAIGLQLSKVGVKANLQVFDNTVSAQRFNQHQTSPMFFSTWLGATLDAEGTLTPRIASGGRSAYFSDPDVDKQIRAGAASVNEAVRLKVYLPLMAELKEKAPWIYLWQGTDTYAVSQRLSGWVPRPDSYLILRDAQVQ